MLFLKEKGDSYHFIPEGPLGSQKIIRAENHIIYRVNYEMPIYV